MSSVQRPLFATLRGNWFAISVLTFFGILVGGALNILVPTWYEASARLFIAAPNWNEMTVSPDPDVSEKSYGNTFTEQRMESYRALIASPRVATGVIERLSLKADAPELGRRIGAYMVPDTVMIDVRARDSSPQQAAKIANAAAEELSALIKQLETPTSRRVSPVQPVLIGPAAIPRGPSSPRLVPNLLSGAIAGLLFGLTYAVVRDRTGSNHAVRRRLVSGDNSVGMLRVANDRVERLSDLSDRIAEDVRFLRVRTAALLDDVGTRSVVFAPPRASDCLRSVGFLVASAFAETGASVVLVMADLKRRGVPAQEVGLGEVLDGLFPLDWMVRHEDSLRFAVVPAGTTEREPIAALASEEMGEVLAELERRFDYVLFIGRPVLESADSLELARRVKAAVLVCQVPPTTEREVRESERLLGLVLPKTPGRMLVVDGSRRHSPRRDADAYRRPLLVKPIGGAEET